MKRTTLLLALLVLCFPVFAIEPFVITDIRVEGLRRLEEGTVFNYLPLKVGDEVNDEETLISIRELFKTGFFSDVALEQEGTILVVKVMERPSIGSITITGNDNLKTEDLQNGLEQAELVEGRIFKQATLDRIERDITDTYLSMGRYSATVTTTVEELDENRVALTLDINEGRVARIKKINIIGAEKEKLSKVLDQMKLRDRRGYALFSRKDQYSKQQLEADIESIKSYYLDRGYHEFEIVSSSVEISPNKQGIFVSIVLNEGEVFSFGEVIVEGVNQEALDKVLPLVTINTGDIFSRDEISTTRSAVIDYFAEQGYAFVEVRTGTQPGAESGTVDAVFSVLLNHRVYVRRIDISGNAFTRDEVVRRELRQLEGAWYSSSLIRRSKDRLQRLGIFESVQIETPPVPGTTDQIDLKVLVVERPTGSALFSVGYSDEDGALFGIEYEQRNLFGTGKDMSFKFNNSDAVDILEIAYTNPYYTPDGISRGFHFLSRDVNSAEVDTAEYSLSTNSLGVTYRIPIAETNTLNLGFSYEKLELLSNAETPPEYLEIISDLPMSDQLILTSGVSRDNRDDFFFPTRGSAGSVTLEASIPGSDFEYYKLSLQSSHYYPLESLTLKGGFSLGVGDGYGDTSEIGLPFFKYYFAGGPRSIRGYRSRSLGPKDTGTTPEPTGGDRRVLVSTELLFPAFGSNARDKRVGVFVDGGMVWGSTQDVSFSDLRYSGGVYFNWFSAIGPLSMSYGLPLNEEDGDDTEAFQLSVGTIFR